MVGVVKFKHCAELQGIYKQIIWSVNQKATTNCQVKRTALYLGFGNRALQFPVVSVKSRDGFFRRAGHSASTLLWETRYIKPILFTFDFLSFYLAV